MAPALWLLGAMLLPALWTILVIRVLARLERRTSNARPPPPSDYQI